MMLRDFEVSYLKGEHEIQIMFQLHPEDLEMLFLWKIAYSRKDFIAIL